ncbi:hypothetical protein Hdeb2414_s0006g00201421 [Helianthus debilis subsp. tardiflorus]
MYRMVLLVGFVYASHPEGCLFLNFIPGVTVLLSFDFGIHRMPKPVSICLNMEAIFFKWWANLTVALQPADNKAHSRFGICTRSNSLYQVITLLSDPGVRRVVAVEAGSQRMLGLITLRDVFSLIFRDLC